jgi:hypothetical protein
MNVLLILPATIAGTTLMTGFSYLMGDAFRKLFKEPVLLNNVIRKSKIELNPGYSGILGWFIHYLIGLTFIIAYDLIWRYTSIELSWLSGAILGAISGIIGILGWMILFRLPSEDPPVHYSAYYLQLFFAHIVFGLGATAVYIFWGSKIAACNFC